MYARSAKIPNCLYWRWLDRGERFWLKAPGGRWEEVDEGAFVRAERAAGFHNTLGHPEKPATSAWSGANGWAGTTLDPTFRHQT